MSAQVSVLLFNKCKKVYECTINIWKLVTKVANEPLPRFRGHDMSCIVVMKCYITVSPFDPWQWGLLQEPMGWPHVHLRVG